MSDWIHGETGGYLRYSTENAQLVRDRLPEVPRGRRQAARSRHERTDEHASHIIEALETGRVYRGHFNVKNNGRHHQPARRTAIIEMPGLRRPLRHQHGRRRHPARGLRRHLHRLDQRAAHGGAGGDDRRRRPAEARRAARSAGRRHLHARRGLADGRRDARRPGAMAAAIRGRHRSRRGAACATPRSRPATGKAPPASRSARSRSCARRKPPRPPRPKASAPAASPDAAVPPTTGAGQAGHRAPLDRAVSAAASPAPARPARRPRQRQGQRPGQEATAAKRRKTLSIDSINVESQALTTRYATHSAPEVDPGTSLAGCAAPAPPL